MIIFGFIASIAVWVWVLRMYDRLEPEPMQTLISVMFFGGIFSILPVLAISAIYEYITFGSKLLYSLAVGFSEEFFKLLATVLLVSGMRDLDEPIDAMIYSMTVALGFAALENILYISAYGNWVLLKRTLLPMPGHMADAAIWGYGLSLYFFRHKGKGRSLVSFIFPYYLAASVAHAAYDYPLFSRQGSAYLSILVLVCVYAVTHFRLRELGMESPFAKAEAVDEEASEG